MATVTVKWTGNPPCGQNNLPYVGESYYLYLDSSYFTVDVTAVIPATFVSEGAGGTGYDRTYTFEFADALVPSGVAELQSCHVKSVACVDSCCAELQRQLDDLQTEVTALTATVTANTVAIAALTP